MANETRTIGGGISFGTASAGRTPRVTINNSGSDFEDSPYASIEVELTTAQVLTLGAAGGVSVIPAPGAGKVLQILGWKLILDYAGVAYTETAANLTLRYTNTAGAAATAAIEATGFLTATADQIKSGTIANDVIQVANAAIVLSAADTSIAAGTSPIRVQVVYAVHSTGL